MRCRLVPSSLLVLLGLLTACGDDEPARDSGMPTDTFTPPEDGGAPATVTAEVGPLTVTPGGESTMCVIRRLALDADVYATRVRARIDEGSHHLILYRLDEGEVRDEPYPCTPFTDILAGNGVPVVLAQGADQIVRYPEGTGLRLSAGQLVRLELHYINTTAEPLDVGASVDFDVTSETEGLEEIGYIFSGTPAIDIGPRSSGRARTTYRPPAGLRLFAVTTHTHQWATEATVTLTNAASPSGAEIHRSTSWSEPPLDTFDPAVELADGDTLDVNCEYTNGSDSFVRFGEGANDEMCFMIALYYPSRGFILDFF